ncbi:MAG: L-amino acid N-acyltransferase YncA [Planctomycetota bacterium]|jgi:L-amino acid N-acyltransferase YncA
MNALIRPATASDAGAIAAIYAPFVSSTSVSFEEQPPDAAEMNRRREANQDTHPYLVAELNGEVLGYSYAGPFRARAAYARTAETAVYLAEAARGQGLGKRLMQAVLDGLTERGFHRAIAGTTLPNPGSVALHESLGFSFVGIFHEVGHKRGSWHDVGFWELALGER